jgi:signal transduction histidine kinase
MWNIDNNPVIWKRSSMVTADTGLQHQSDFQRLVIHLATRFINQPIEQMDEAITQALREVVEFLGAARASINQISEDRSSFTGLYSWASPKMAMNFPSGSSLPDPLRVLSNFSQRKPITVSDIDQLPEDDEIRQLLEPYGIKAIVAVPVFVSNQLFGFISITWTQRRETEPEILDLLRIVGEIFLNALNRKRHEEQVQRFNTELEQRVIERTVELSQINRQLQAEIADREDIEAALRESEGQMRLILESLPIPVTVVEDVRDIVYVNPVAAAILNVSPHHNDLRLDPENFYVDMNDRDAMMGRLELGGSVSGFELRYRAYPDQVRIGLMSAQSIQFAGQPARIFTLVDITDLKQTQDAERVHRLFTEALLDAAMALAGTLEFDDILGHILSNLRRVLPHDLANIMIADGDEILIVRQQYADSESIAAQDRRLSSRGMPQIKHLFEIDYPILASSLTDSLPLIPDFVEAGIGSYVGVPIIVGKQVIGWINLGSRTPKFFTETHVNYLQIFALQAGTAIQNARLFKQAQTLAAMEERQHLARELHDSVTQSLFSANSIAEALPVMMDKAPQEAHNYVSELHLLTRGAMAEMRSLLFELRPATLEQTDLSVLLSELCHTFTGKTRIPVDTRLVKKLSLPSDVQLAFYRITQEALNNAAKYARAQHVTLDLIRTTSGVELHISDDGCGFEASTITADHFGLKMMRERAEVIHAEFSITSKPGGGTQITLRRPL